jgi:hypothetical protein
MVMNNRGSSVSVPTLVYDLDAATYTGFSAQFSGSNSLSVPNSAALNPGTGDFTIEFWTYLNSITNNSSLYRGSNGGVDVFLNGSGRLAVGCAGISTLIVDSVTMTTGAWVHVAAVRISGATRLYKNGVQAGSAGDGTNYVTSTTTTIGTGSSSITGYMSNLRVVIGLGVYTGAFTPPTSALALTQSSGTNISAITAGQTQLLLPLNATPFTDSSTNAITVTNTGTVVPGVQYPFTSTDATGTYTITRTNAGSLTRNSADGGSFAKSNNVGTDVIYGGPNYVTAQSYTVFMAYKLSATASGRLLNTQSEASKDWLMGAYNGNPKTFYPNFSVNLPSTGADTVWHLDWATWNTTTGVGNLYASTSTAPSAVTFTATNAGGGGFNQLRMFSRSAGSEVQSGNIAFIKVYDGVLALATIQSLHATHKSRFGY